MKLTIIDFFTKDSVVEAIIVSTIFFIIPYLFIIKSTVYRLKKRKRLKDGIAVFSFTIIEKLTSTLIDNFKMIFNKEDSFFKSRAVAYIMSNADLSERVEIIYSWYYSDLKLTLVSLEHFAYNNTIEIEVSQKNKIQRDFENIITFIDNNTILFKEVGVLAEDIEYLKSLLQNFKDRITNSEKIMSDENESITLSQMLNQILLLCMLLFNKNEKRLVKFLKRLNNNRVMLGKTRDEILIKNGFYNSKKT